MRQLNRLAPLAAGVWNRAPRWLRGAVTWGVTGKVIVGVSGVLLNDEEQVLLLRHRFHGTRMWGLPGGWLTPGETIYNCWRREVKEELALETSVEAVVCHRATRRILEFYLLGRIDGGELKIDPVEILEARFFATDSLPPMESFGRQVIREAIIQVEAEESRRVGRTDQGPGGGSGEPAREVYPIPRGEKSVESDQGRGDASRA